MPEVLEAERGPPAVASQQREPGRESAARAAAVDRDAVGVDAELVGLLVQPGQRGVAVLETGGEGVFGREPVLDRHHDHAELARQRRGAGVLGVDAADEEPAAVDVDDCGHRARRDLRGVDPHGRRPVHRPVPGSTGRRRRGSRCRRRRPAPRGTAATARVPQPRRSGPWIHRHRGELGQLGIEGVGHRGIVEATPSPQKVATGSGCETNRYLFGARECRPVRR